MHTKILPKTPLQTVVLSNLPLASLNKMPNAATVIRYPPHLASSWLCNRCTHSNGSSRNKKRCFSCQAWRNGLAPLSAKGGGTSAKGGSTSTSGAAASDVGLVSDDATFHDENGPPNNASPRRDRSPRKRGEKRKSPSRGLGGVLCPSTPPERIRRQARSTMPNFLLLAITLQDTTCLVGIRDFSSFSLLVITIIYSLLLPSDLSANSNIHSVAPPSPPWKFIRCTRFFALDANLLPSDTTLWPEEMEPAPPLPSPRTAAPRAPPSPLGIRP